MKKEEFYKIYIPALEKAFENDNINYGFSIFGPDYYISPDKLNDIDSYLIKTKDDLLDLIGYYFDAKSHNFPNLQGIELGDVKKSIITKITDLKTLYKI